jgi:hypothetical protein
MMNPDGRWPPNAKTRSSPATSWPPSTVTVRPPIALYYDSAGAKLTTISASSLDSVVRIRLSLASQDTSTANAPRSQASTEIRLANRATSKNVNFVVYNSNSTSKTLGGIDIAFTGSNTPTLTKITLGTVAIWTGSKVLSSPIPRCTPSPMPSIAATTSQQSTLWFTSTSSIAGTYSVNYVPTSGASLATTFNYAPS